EDPRAGRAVGEAVRLRPRVLEERRREDRGGGRQRQLAEAAAREEGAPSQEGRTAGGCSRGCRGRDRGAGGRGARGARGDRRDLVLSWLANAWRVPELRRRLLFTAAVLALYRLGSFIPAPGIDPEQFKSGFNQNNGGGVFNLLNLFSGNALSRFSLFALGIMPYITASIILQLMAVVVPTLAQLQKEGEAGYAKINQYTRYLTIALAAAQAIGYSYLFRKQGILDANL